MQGRWTITHDSEGKARTVTRERDARSERNGWGAIPVVPCDDAAVERGAEALDDLLLMLGVEPTYAPEHAPSETVKRTLARAVLRAAGETL